MDRERLTRLLEEPAHVARPDLADLRALTERFPWFSGAQLLLAVGEQAAGDMLFDEQLKVTAVHLPSRGVLFDNIHQKPEKPAAMLTVVREGPAPALLEKPVAPAPLAEPPETLPEVTVEAVAEPVPSPAADPPAPQEVPAPTADPLDVQLRRSALAGSYDITRALPPATPPVARIPAPPAPLAQPAVAEALLREEPVIVMTEPPSSPSMATRLRFTEWLERSGGEADAMPAPVEKPVLPPVGTDEIIDRFIQGTMPAPAKKAVFFTPQQAAKRSLEDDGLVSETLARIHGEQGNIAKAIEIYQRLALKHPEKSAYFAALSKALEGGSNK